MLFFCLIFLASRYHISFKELSSSKRHRKKSLVYMWGSVCKTRQQNHFEDIIDTQEKQSQAEIDVKEKSRCTLQKAEVPGPSVKV